MQSNILRIELLIASILPTAAILLLGVIGIEQMQETNVLSFLTVLIISAAAVFFAEYAVISFMQRATRKQFDELVVVCQDFFERRPDIHGDNALTTLAQVLHMLLDAVSQGVQPVSHHADVSPNKEKTSEQTQLNTQLQKLIREIAPALNGDLRVSAEIPQGNVGVVADLCNSLVAEIIELVQWTRYSSEQVTSGTRTLMNCSIDLAQTVETQMLRFTQTTQMVETLTAFLENLCGTLQVNVKVLQKMQMYVKQYASDTSLQDNDFQQQLEADTEYQEQILAEVLNLAQSNIPLAKSVISDFYTFARHIHESSTGILQTAEHINSFAALAEQWYNAVIAFKLPIAAEEQILQASTATSSISSPSLSPTREN